MPSLGPAEILVILVIALLVFGPNKLPDVAKQAGKAFQELRRVQQHLRSEISGAMSDLDGSSSSGTSTSPSADAPGGDSVPMLPARESDAPADAVMPPAPAPDTSAPETPPPSSPPPADPA
jgi:sec-independent protein translocase protein TatA